MAFNLSTTENAALQAVAKANGVRPDSLWALIQFESSWNPSARNSVTGAMGLIQFMPKTAQALGYASSADLVQRYPDRASQLLGPVNAYLKGFRPFSGSDQDLFMAVFVPAARSWPLTAQFSQGIQDANPGIKTPGDYIKKVYAAARGVYYPYAGAAVAVLALLIYLFRSGSRHA